MVDWWFARWERGVLKPGQQICQCCDDHPADCQARETRAEPTAPARYTATISSSPVITAD